LNEVRVVFQAKQARIHQSQPAQGKEMSSVVTALDVNLDRGLKETLAGLNQYFSENRAGCGMLIALHS
jgi:hypothetical protein